MLHQTAQFPWSAFLSASLCISLLLACGGQGADEPPDEVESVGLLAPGALSLACKSVASRLNTVEASDFIPGYAQNVIAAGGDALFNPVQASAAFDFESASFAVYAFDSPQYLPGNALHLKWLDGAPNKLLWVGCSDLVHNCWAWQQAASGDVDVTIPKVEDLLGDGNQDRLYIALMLGGSGYHGLDHLRIGPPLQENAILAIPSKTLVHAGESVSITVFANLTPGPFKNVDSVRIVVPASCTYVRNSYNAGREGGAPGDVDGVFETMQAEFIIAPPDAFIQTSDLGGGRIGITFNVTSVGGDELSNVSGELFNFRLVVREDTAISFQREDAIVKRTYYSDASGREHFWEDDTNAGMPTIHVER